MILTIEAGPGSGKTYTITNAYHHIQGAHVPKLPTSDEQQVIYDTLRTHFPPREKPYKVVYLAHTNTAKENMIARLPKKTPVYTFHGAGYVELIKQLGYQKYDSGRLDGFIQAFAEKSYEDMPFTEKLGWYRVKSLIGHFKVENMKPTEENYDYIRSKYPDMVAMDSVQKMPDDWKPKVESLLLRCQIPNKCVDHDDMVWMALKHIRSARYDIGFIDECQDLSRSTFALVQAICRNLVLVGDRNQAIMAFAGADEEMFNKVLTISDVVLPLKTTFRNPVNIVERANKLIPGSVLPGPNKEIGEDMSISYQSMISRLKTLPAREGKKLNVMIVSRTNAPLLPLGLSLVKNGFGVELADKDFGGKIINFIKKTRANSIPDLLDKLEQYQEIEAKKPHPMAGIMAEELCGAIVGIAEGCKNLNDLYANIKVVVQEVDKPDRFLLSTIHKSKGLEANNVFIMNPPIEHPLASSHPITKKQEQNLHFVAITRTSKNQYWVQ
jgi:superfamily I DNA/RNA helicase